MAYRIRELREKKKLTQEQLAQMSGVSRTTIVLLENNEEHEAMVGTLKSLAAALNVPVSKLFTQKVWSSKHEKDNPQRTKAQQNEQIEVRSNEQ